MYPKIGQEYTEEFIDINFPEIKELCVKMVEAGENEKGEKLYQIVIDPKTGSSSEGGVSDYDLLSNRPRINGVTLTGNKTSDDLKIIGGSGSSAFSITDESELTSLNAKPGSIATLYNKTVTEAGAWKALDDLVALGGTNVSQIGNVLWNHKRKEYFMLVSYTATEDSSIKHAIFTSADAIAWTFFRDVDTSMASIIASVDGLIVGRYSTNCYFIDEETYIDVQKTVADLGGVASMNAKLANSAYMITTDEGWIISNNNNASYYKLLQVSKDGGITWADIELEARICGIAYGDGYIYIKLSSSKLLKSSDLITFEPITLERYGSASTQCYLQYLNGKLYWVGSNNYSICMYDTLSGENKVYNLPYYGTKSTVPYLEVYDGYLYIFEQKLTSGTEKHDHRITKTLDGISYDLVSEADASMDGAFNNNNIRALIKDGNIVVFAWGLTAWNNTAKRVAVNIGGQLTGETTIRRAYVLVNDPTVLGDWLKIGGI